MIYLDAAATSLLKPPGVARAVAEAVSTCASPGRGVYSPAMRAAETVYSCREEAADLFRACATENVVFTMNATHGLNMAIRSVVKPGMRVLISGYEHNAVVRPLAAVGAETETIVGEAFNEDSFLEELKKRIPGSGAVVCTHVSNVFGFRLPMEEIARICREYGVPLIVDAAQSAGHCPIDMSGLSAAFIAMPGHKGLMGPQGTGILLCGRRADPLLFGGTGSMSDSLEMPEDLPERLEAGTQNVCGIAGLRQGIRFIRAVGVDQLAKREKMLCGVLAQGLERLPELHVVSVPEKSRAGVISVIPENMDCETFAAALGRAGVAVRSGLHCAPLAHRTAGTIDTGTVRFSVSPLNTEEEILSALRIIKNIKK